jgi:membrane protease YdiL (CAAX protease family)
VFCLLAVGIGVCEELLYRGFLQGWLRGRGRWLGVVGAAVAHTAYKCSLFILPAGPERANLPVLAAVTVAGGIIMGLMRDRVGSLVFPLIVHGAFDAVAYGDLATAPWWVW